MVGTEADPTLVLMFHISAAAGLKSVQSNRKRNYIFVINDAVSYEDLSSRFPDTRNLKPTNSALASPLGPPFSREALEEIYNL